MILRFTTPANLEAQAGAEPLLAHCLRAFHCSVPFRDKRYKIRCSPDQSLLKSHGGHRSRGAWPSTTILLHEFGAGRSHRCESTSNLQGDRMGGTGGRRSLQDPGMVTPLAASGRFERRKISSEAAPSCAKFSSGGRFGHTVGRWPHEHRPWSFLAMPEQVQCRAPRHPLG